MDSSLLTLHLIMLLILWRGAIASIRKHPSDYSKCHTRIFESAQANIRNAPHEYSKMPKRIIVPQWQKTRSDELSTPYNRPNTNEGTPRK